MYRKWIKLIENDKNVAFVDKKHLKILKEKLKEKIFSVIVAFDDGSKIVQTDYFLESFDKVMSKFIVLKTDNLSDFCRSILRTNIYVSEIMAEDNFKWKKYKSITVEVHIPNFYINQVECSIDDDYDEWEENRLFVKKIII